MPQNSKDKNMARQAGKPENAKNIIAVVSLPLADAGNIFYTASYHLI